MHFKLEILIINIFAGPFTSSSNEGLIKLDDCSQSIDVDEVSIMWLLSDKSRLLQKNKELDVNIHTLPTISILFCQSMVE